MILIITNRKNVTLELVKLFASYMIVFIHVSFNGNFGVIMDSLARFAVPFFFLVSGFFSCNITHDKIKKRAKHIAKLIVFSSVLYVCFRVGENAIKGDIPNISSYLGKYLDIKNWIRFFFLNTTVSSIHLWYLFAILYVYIIFYFVKKLHINEKMIFAFSFGLLFLHILLGEILSAFDIVIPYVFMRNFALMGIPFFGIGLYVKKHCNRLYHIPNKVIIMAAAAGVFSTVISRYFFGKNELYIGSLFILFAVVVIFIKFSTIHYPSAINSLSDCSIYIYIFHIIVSTLIKDLYTVFNINTDTYAWLLNMHPVIVCVASTALAWFLKQTTRKIKEYKSRTASNSTK